MKKNLLIIFILLWNFSFSQEVKNDRYSIDGNYISVEFDIEPYSSNTFKDEKYRIFLLYRDIFSFDDEEKDDWFENPQNSRFRRLNFPEQNQLFSPGDNQKLKIDITKIKNFKEFFGSKKRFALSLELEPYSIPIILKKINLSRKNVKMEFYGPKDQVEYKVSISKESKKNKSIVFEDTWIPDPSSPFQSKIFQFDPKISRGKYTLTIESNNYGKHILKEDARVRNYGIKIPSIVVGASLIIKFVVLPLLSDRNKSKGLPLLPDPPDPNG